MDGIIPRTMEEAFGHGAKLHVPIDWRAVMAKHTLDGAVVIVVAGVGMAAFSAVVLVSMKAIGWML